MTHKEYIEGLRELSHMIQTALALDGKAPIPSDVEGLPPVQAWDFGLAEDRHDFASRLSAPSASCTGRQSLTVAARTYR
jgi:hypothetical protein